MFFVTVVFETSKIPENVVFYNVFSCLSFICARMVEWSKVLPGKAANLEDEGVSGFRILEFKLNQLKF